MNFLILSIDCLRPDHMSCYGYERNTTPNIDKLALLGTRFTNAYSPSSHTPEAVPAILTGKYPVDAVNEEYILSSKTIAEKIPIKTAAFHSNVNISRAYGYGSGFDKFEDDIFSGKNEFLAKIQRGIKKYLYNRPTYYARAPTINQWARNWLDSQPDDEPVLMWLHYMDVHGPYVPPVPYRDEYLTSDITNDQAKELFSKAMDDPNNVSDEEREILIDLYDAEIRYVDKHIGNLLDDLSSSGMKDWMTFVISDHGDGFGDNGYFNHPRYLKEDLVAIPLIVNDINGPDTVNVPVSTLDIIPSINKIVRNDSEHFDGIPLQDICRDTTMYAERVIFSQCRGEGDDENIRRFAARNSVSESFLSRNIETGKIICQEGTNEKLNEKLKVFSRTKLKNTSDEVKDRMDINEDIDKRLQALGYK